MTAEQNITYCDFNNFYRSYEKYHLYITFVVCTFGSITNILNICVLTTKQMRCPTNSILTGLATANLLVMLDFMPFVCLNTNKSHISHFAYSLATFMLFHALFTQVLHFISCCLTIVLAVWRYIAIKFPQNNNKWCNDRRTFLTISATFCLCPFTCIPLYQSLKIIPTNVLTFPNGTINFKKSASNFSNNTEQVWLNATMYRLSYEEDEALKHISFYVYGVVIKLIPCILLTILSYLLIVELLKAKKRRRNLISSTLISKENGNCKRKANQRHLEREKQADRTTRMLLAVLLIFLITEFPQAIVGLLNHIIGETFEKECYRPLGDLVDIFTLMNSSVNFLLYCAMSQKFRKVFQEIFVPCISKSSGKWVSLQTLKSYV